MLMLYRYTSLGELPVAKFLALRHKVQGIMTDLNRALTDIRDIRRQVAQTTEFQGYGPFTLSATAIVALLAGAAQSRWVPAPAIHPIAYVAVWLTTGIFCALLIASQMFTRASRLHIGIADEMIRMAVTHFCLQVL